VNVFGTITGVMASALTGVVIVPRGEGTLLEFALADRSGRIVWYNVRQGSTDLRQAAASADFVAEALQEFPGRDR